MRCIAKVLGLILCLGLAAGVLAQEKKIMKKDLPVPVLSSFQKAYPGATIKGLAREVEEGKTYFEIESVEGKVKRDLLYLADGTLVEIEETVGEADLPIPVKAAAAARYPKGKVVRAEKVTRGGAVSFELRVRVGKAQIEMSIDAAGKVLKESKGSIRTEGKEAGEKDQR